MALWVVRLERGGPWDWSRNLREQDGWDDHARFMDALVDSGFILLGGPLEGDRMTLHIVEAESEAAIRERLAEDPWAANGMLRPASIEGWTVLLDGVRKAPTESVSPILPARDVPATLAFYERLGFTTDLYDDGYGFAHRGPVSLHFSRWEDLDPFTNEGAAYIEVADIDRAHRKCRKARVWQIPSDPTPEIGAEVRRKWSSGQSIARMTPIEDKPWGMREFELLDPDNNLVRFGQRRPEPAD